MILRRRSVRSYTTDAVDEAVLAEITAFVAGLKPLFPEAAPEARIISTKEAVFLQKWHNPQFFVFYAPATEEGLLNVGFMYQQLDLYLQSKGLGTCWVGLGAPADAVHKPPQGMKLAVMMAFGHPDNVPERSGETDFRRHKMADITDVPDGRLEPARLAPSATNSQPWAFLHEGDTIHVYREKLALIKARTHGRMNQIDMGIMLAHLYVCHPETFRFERREAHPEKAAYLYIGSVTL
ncbi:MAG: hypothetical protein IJE07_09885 [Clostridia bacterium]|nr:hypothetical protein [Clostridia bacterium]